MASTTPRHGILHMTCRQTEQHVTQLSVPQHGIIQPTLKSTAQVAAALVVHPFVGAGSLERHTHHTTVTSGRCHMYSTSHAGVHPLHTSGDNHRPAAQPHFPPFAQSIAFIYTTSEAPVSNHPLQSSTPTVPLPKMCDYKAGSVQ